MADLRLLSETIIQCHCFPSTILSVQEEGEPNPISLARAIEEHEIPSLVCQYMKSPILALALAPGLAQLSQPREALKKF